MGNCVAVVIPTFRRAAKLTACLDSLRASEFTDLVAIVVNDGGCAETSRMLRKMHPGVVELVSDRDLWWAGSMNLGVRHARSLDARYCLVLNDDVTIAPAALGNLIAVAESASLAIVCSVVADSCTKEAVWAAGGGLSWPLRGEFHHTRVQRNSEASGDVAWSPGMGTLIPMEVFEKVGLFDDVNMPQYLADADLCLRARRVGIPIRLCNDSHLYNDTNLTGGLPPSGRISLKEAVAVFSSKKSSEFFRARVVFTWRHCPRSLFALSLTVRYARVGAHVLRRMLSGGARCPASPPSPDSASRV